MLVCPQHLLSYPLPICPLGHISYSLSETLVPGDALTPPPPPENLYGALFLRLGTRLTTSLAGDASHNKIFKKKTPGGALGIGSQVAPSMRISLNGWGWSMPWTLVWDPKARESANRDPKKEQKNTKNGFCGGK